jgi:hypothetical protein
MGAFQRLLARKSTLKSLFSAAEFDPNETLRFETAG